MSNSPHVTRREMVLGAAAALASSFVASRGLAADAPAPGSGTATRGRRNDLRLGVASISLRDLSIESVVSVLQQLEIRDVSIFRTHAMFETGTPDACRAAAEGFRAGGINPWTTSVVRLTRDEAAARRAFDNVRAAGMTMMTCNPAPDALPLLNDLVQEYDIKLAIHNHGPEDEVYPSAVDALRRVENLDRRIGVCNDVGHTMRAGDDPAESIRITAPRLFDVHLKDSLAAAGAKDIPVEVGRGNMDIRAILAALLEVNYTGVVAFEYERMGVNAATGLAESVGYVRGLLAGM